jgi:hypothetical protein
MGLSRYSLSTALDIKRVLSSSPRNDEVVIAKMIQSSIEKWVYKISGNRMVYPKMKVCLLDFDSDTIAILLQAGMDVVSCFDWMRKENDLFVWCHADVGNEIPTTAKMDFLMPYYPAMIMPPVERKKIHEENLDMLLLGNPLFHPSSYRSTDLLAQIGSIVGPFVWCAPSVSIGKMATIGAHCSIGNNCVIGDYCQIDQNVTMQGGVVIGEGCKIGAGTIIFPGVKIAPFTTINTAQIVKFNMGVK